MLPDWTHWCLAQSDPGEEFAAARAEAATLVDPVGGDSRRDSSNEGPLRRAE